MNSCPKIELMMSVSNCGVNGDFTLALFSKTSMSSKHSELVWPMYCSSCKKRTKEMTKKKKKKKTNDESTFECNPTPGDVGRVRVRRLSCQDRPTSSRTSAERREPGGACCAASDGKSCRTSRRSTPRRHRCLRGRCRFHRSRTTADRRLKTKTER